MSFQQQQPGTGSKQKEDMNRKKSKTSADVVTNPDDEMAANRMDSEGDVAGTSSLKKGRKT